MLSSCGSLRLRPLAGLLCQLTPPAFQTAREARPAANAFAGAQIAASSESPPEASDERRKVRWRSAHVTLLKFCDAGLLYRCAFDRRTRTMLQLSGTIPEGKCRVRI